MDISAVIQNAKLGRGRKEAQVDTCSVFAAALYDVLTAQGLRCKMVTATKKEGNAWAHSVVEVEGRYYDSMGEFSTDIYRARAKIHPSVVLNIKYLDDIRNGCYEQEFDEYHAFYVKMLEKALRVETSDPCMA